MKHTIAFMTLGCKVNQYETDRLRSECEQAGYIVVPFDGPADVYAVNTCTVTNIADRKSRKMLHRGKRLNPDAIVVAMGCFADAAKEVLNEDDTIDIVICNADKNRAFSIIDGAVRAVPYYSDKDNANTNTYSVLSDNSEISTVNVDSSSGITDSDKCSGRTRVFLKVQDGCNQFCSYCKIPYVRGRLKSRDTENVYEEAVKIAEGGCREIVLTGIHLSSYGVDEGSNKSFIELGGIPLLRLIKRLSDIEGLDRIRLGSLEPRIITETFVKELAGMMKVCPHFHLSLQSGCDTVLKRMNRKYTASEYLQACDIIRKYYDRPAITTDIIVGFPGETDEEFRETACFVKKAGFADVHIFKYSRRDGTKAAAMPDQVDEGIKNERSSVLIELGFNMTHDYISDFVGNEQKCLVEETVMIDGSKYWIGHNERYVRIALPFEEGQMLQGDIVQIIPCGIRDNILL